jgi:DNA-directed RNA polymerase specialized sigma24 family protein
MDTMAKMQSSDPESPIRLTTFDQYRRLLFSVACRMLGSVADAEDMLQETFIRWQEAPDKEIRSPRAFLVTIISRLCINHLQSARVQREEYLGCQPLQIREPCHKSRPCAVFCLGCKVRGTLALN